jgi:hypothetical protein
MTSKPKPNQSAPMRSSRRQAGVNPAYQFRTGSGQAMAGSLARARGAGKPRRRAAILCRT